jgi:eukaryotic-like serine/threonine-protein kinase
MTPERWQQIEALFHAALEIDAGERAAFLAKSEASLREEVERLLEQQSGNGAIDRPAWEHADLTSATRTQVTPGMQLGPYRVEAKIGAGGMGEVYRACDSRLGRRVAIKISAAQFSGRFEREARAIAALNHPHICTLYDVGPNYLVMELVEGETLAARLKRGKLSRGEVLKYGVEIADALAAAHAEGIVHRDLKPGNIMLGKGGVKVLDFGLAKPADSGTLTGSNVVMGTPAYMAPEQHDGKECDARTDIYALGLVLYEMATGKRARAGEDQRAEDLPPFLGTLLRRCLAEDPDERWQSAKDLSAVLSWTPKAEPSSIQVGSTPVQWRLWAGGCLAAALGLIWAFTHAGATRRVERSIRLEMTPPPGTEFVIASGGVVSPDGRMIAFVARKRAGAGLWVRPLDSSEARELPGTDQASAPFWSPDGKSLGFFASGKLKRIEVTGGFPKEICAAPSANGGTWNEEGIILFSAVNDGPLLKVAAAGGTPAAVTAVDVSRRENSHRWPYFLPGGKRFLYFVRASDIVRDSDPSTGIYLGNLDKPSEKLKLVEAPSSGVFGPLESSSGSLIWVRAGGDLVTQTLDVEAGRLSGEPSVLASGLPTTVGGRRSNVSVSRNGLLVYGSPGLGSPAQLTFLGRDGAHSGVLGEPGIYDSLKISPDGQRVALAGGEGAMWFMEMARGLPIRAGDGYFGPVWSPDGTTIVFCIGGPPNLYARKVNGSEGAERLIDSPDSLYPLDWSPDGRYLLFRLTSNDPSQKASFDLWLMDMREGRKTAPFTSTPFKEGRSQFSPDGRWIAYTADESGREEVYVQSFPAGGKKWQVSREGGDAARWRMDGKELFYVNAEGKVTAVTVRAEPGSVQFGPPIPLFELPSRAPSPQATSGLRYSYDVMPNGQRFLALVPVGAPGTPSITVLSNWRAELGKKN